MLIGWIAGGKAWPTAVKLIARELSVARGGRPVIEGLSFTVAGGEALQLTGPNGAGKTTLLRVVAGLLPASGGDVRLEGREDGQPIGQSCHYVGHLDALKARLSVAENLEFWAQFLGGRAEPGVIAAALARLGLDGLAGIPAAYLSAGQKRRLCLARLVVAERPAWLLDEPTASLDAAGQEVLAGLVREHLGRGGLALIATHVALGLGEARELRLGGGA